MSEIKVEDKRHWAKDNEEPEVEVLTPVEETEAEEETPRLPSFVEELKTRAEVAETKLHEYIEAFKKSRDEQDEVRARLTRDVERRVQLQFAGLVGSFLETLDNLDLAIENSGDSPADGPLIQGVTLARDRFVAILGQQGVERVLPQGEEFDPNTSEALRMDAVTDKNADGTVTEVLRAGYRLGDHVIRPARVAVGKFAGKR